ncbi:MAG: site-2 protease family protein [Pseudomonadota bacterium]
MFGNGDSLFEFRGPFGVPVHVSSSVMVLALVFVGLNASSTEDMIFGATLFAMLMVSIFLHEFGHALGALIQGVAVERVVLHGGGGFCQTRPRSIRQSEFIVMMGPIVNLALWAIASLCSWWIWQRIDRFEPAAISDVQSAMTWLRFAGYLDIFATINLILFALNLAPVQPLDGGRLLSYGLMRILPRDLALRVSGAIGLTISVVWLPAMLVLFYFFGWLLLFFPSIGLHWRMVRGVA